MVAKKDKPAVAGFEPAVPGFEMPNFEMPKMDMPIAVREFAEKGVAQAKDVYEKMKTAAEETTDMMEDAYASYSKGTVEYAGKAIDFSKSNTIAAFDFIKDVMTAKSFAELVEKQTTFARTQFEALSHQGKELQSLAQKIANDTAAPYKAAAEKVAAEFKKSA
jgi:phasin